MPSMRINQKYFEVVINKSFLIFIERNIDLKSKKDNNSLSFRNKFE